MTLYQKIMEFSELSQALTRLAKDEVFIATLIVGTATSAIVGAVVALGLQEWYELNLKAAIRKNFETRKANSNSQKSQRLRKEFLRNFEIVDGWRTGTRDITSDTAMSLMKFLLHFAFSILCLISTVIVVVVTLYIRSVNNIFITLSLGGAFFLFSSWAVASANLCFIELNTVYERHQIFQEYEFHKKNLEPYCDYFPGGRRPFSRDSDLMKK